MSMFRKTRISNEQLQSILRTLPQAKASADFEGNLEKMIASNSHHVPNLLGSLPLVPAPDDFDARLMEAIRDRRRPVAPIPIAVAAGGASINWINHITGWIGGSLAVVALAFFINHATEIVPEKTVVSAPAQHAAGSSVTAPAAAPAATTPKLSAPAANAPASGMRATVAQAEQPQAVTPGIVRERMQSVAPATSVRRSTAVQTAPALATPELNIPAATTTAPQTPPAQHDVRNTTTDPGVVNGSVDVATGPSKPDDDSNASAAEKEEGTAQMPEGVVNTGADPGVDTNRPR